VRRQNGRVNAERAFWDIGNFVTGTEDEPIPGNQGSAWPASWARRAVWGDSQ